MGGRRRGGVLRKLYWEGGGILGIRFIFVGYEGNLP